MSHPFDQIPPLAGLASYADASHIGFSVEENVRRLVRLHWVERSLMRLLVRRLTSEPVWEVKCALARHQWEGAERVEAIRRRIAEMRSPVPRLDLPAADDPTIEAIEELFEEMGRAPGTTTLITGVYGVVYPALHRAYEAHAAHSNPLVDQPTRRIMRAALHELDETLAWGAGALAALTAASDAEGRAADAWRRHIGAFLDAAGGLAGDAPPSTAPLPARAAERADDFHPRRDERFHGQYNFEFPPHVVYAMPDVPADERNLALLCKRALEMDVPEMMASFIAERDDAPWEFHRDYARQLWDEARHAMMGTVALAARGVDWKRILPLNVSFALRLNAHATPLERQMMLYAIEQSLMPGETGKRYEYETAIEAGDALSAHFHDYDWADEVLHAQIGRRMLKREGIASDEARERARGIHEKTWAALARYAHLDEQIDWWPDFVRTVLGKESATLNERPPLKIFGES